MSEKDHCGCSVEEILVFNQEGHSRDVVQSGKSLTIRFLARVTQDIFFDPVFRLSLLSLEDGRVRYTRHMGEDGWDIS